MKLKYSQIRHHDYQKENFLQCASLEGEIKKALSARIKKTGKESKMEDVEETLSRSKHLRSSCHSNPELRGFTKAKQ